MIIIAGTVEIDPARRDAALKAGLEHEAAGRAEAGCLDYVWTADSHNPGRIYVYERWESQQALEAHFQSAAYRDMRATINGHGIRGANVAKYRIDLAEPVYDPTGRPRADFFTAAG